MLRGLQGRSQAYLCTFDWYQPDWCDAAPEYSTSRAAQKRAVEEEDEEELEKRPRRKRARVVAVCDQDGVVPQELPAAPPKRARKTTAPKKTTKSKTSEVKNDTTKANKEAALSPAALSAKGRKTKKAAGTSARASGTPAESSTVAASSSRTRSSSEATTVAKPGVTEREKEQAAVDCEEGSQRRMKTPSLKSRLAAESARLEQEEKDRRRRRRGKKIIGDVIDNRDSEL